MYGGSNENGSQREWLSCLLANATFPMRCAPLSCPKCLVTSVSEHGLVRSSTRVNTASQGMHVAEACPTSHEPHHATNSVCLLHAAASATTFFKMLTALALQTPWQPRMGATRHAFLEGVEVDHLTNWCVCVVLASSCVMIVSDFLVGWCLRSI